MITTTINLDPWQEEVLNTSGNICLRSGRQVGKSTIISIKAGKYALEHPRCSIMVISATERQAYLLFSKILQYLTDNFKNSIKKGKHRPTKTQINLSNGSTIRCLPTGMDGLGIRGYTVDMLIADEAAFIPEDVWTAVTPMLITTGGNIILLSTPCGREGYFYERFYDQHFTSFHVTTEEVAEARQEPQKGYMLDYLAKEKKSMSELQYAQEYLGEFVDDLRQLFSEELIKRVCVLKRPQNFSKNEFYTYLGVDVARMGGDEITFEIIKKVDETHLYQIENIKTTFKLSTFTYDKILELDNIYNFKQIGIDAGSGSLGVGVLDFLLRSPVKRKVVALNNRARQLDYHGEKKQTLQKEDMYFNMLALMEKGYLKLLDDDEVILSLKSVQYEHQTKAVGRTTTRVFGNYTHIAEGLVRACELAKQKSIKLAITYI